MHGEVLHSEKGRGRHRFHLAFCISLFLRFYPASSFKFQPRRTSSFLICVTLNRQLERAAAGRRGGHDPRSVQLTQAPLAWSGTGQREERREVESRKRLIKENQADGERERGGGKRRHRVRQRERRRRRNVHRLAAALLIMSRGSTAAAARVAVPLVADLN